MRVKSSKGQNTSTPGAWIRSRVTHRARESSALFSANDGFSVVAPISVINLHGREGGGRRRAERGEGGREADRRRESGTKTRKTTSDCRHESAGDGHKH